MPRTFSEKGFEGNSQWVHENGSMRVIVDYRKNPAATTLRQKREFKQKTVRFNDLDALLCYFVEPPASEKGTEKKVLTIFFVEKRKQLGAPNEPSFRVEFLSHSERDIALRILQTVRFYDS